MPDDEESRVRQRLSRLFDPPTSEADPRDRAGGPGSVPGPPVDADASRPLPDPVPDSRLGTGSEELPWSVPPDPPEAATSGARRSSGPRRSASPQLAAGNQFILSAATVGDRLASPPAAVGDDEKASSRPSLLPGPGAFDPGRRGVRALVAVALVVVFGAGLWAWRSRPHAEPVRPVSTVAAPDAPEPSPAGSPGAVNGQLVVAVAGKVRRPGLVRLPAGSRVADAVEAAGGALPGVDVALLNPARKLTDGELVLVGVAAPPGLAGQPGGPAAGGAAGPAVAGAAPGGPVNLNTATLAQLDALPGVGPVLAQRILDHREQHGGFRSVSDLRQVEGIGDARYEQLKDLVTV